MSGNFFPQYRNNFVMFRSMSMKSKMEKKIPCPWCERGAVIGSEDAKGQVSVVCPKCRRCFTVDLGTGRGQRASPIVKKTAV